LPFDADSSNKGVKRTRTGKEKVQRPATAEQQMEPSSEPEEADDLPEGMSNPEPDFDPDDPEGYNRAGPSTGRR
jgi:hypothetical protein